MSDESIVREFEQQQVGTIKLSEAMRRGAKYGPQCKHLLRDGNSFCAFGAVAIGRGWNPDSEPRHALRFLRDVYVTPLWDQISGWNDRGLTREEIADRLESEGF